jgi:sugar O-acyltransferase (sialic acid O-acetyltransferase NeuD family)
MKLIGVFGASGFGREILPLVRHQLSHENPESFKLVFIDDASPSSIINGVTCLNYKEFIEHKSTHKQVTLAIANSIIREQLALRCMEDKIEFFQVRASNVVELDDVQMGTGAILSPFVTLTSNISIGRQFHANIYSYVAHDCTIGDFVTFAPSVKCNGNVVIEDHAYIGTAATIRQGTPNSPLVIGRGAVIGMGAVVTKSVPPGLTVVGNPAKPLIKNNHA